MSKPLPICVDLPKKFLLSSFLSALIACGALTAILFSPAQKPWKTVFFLRASINVDGFNGSAIFGPLSYCLELSNGTTCSIPSMKGYGPDIKSVVGENLPIQIPLNIVQLSIAIAILHIIAFALAALAVLAGLVPGPVCTPGQRTFFSGIAALTTVIVTVLDFVVVIGAHKRINSLTDGGHAQLSWALWLTLAASCLLILSVIVSRY